MLLVATLRKKHFVGSTGSLVWRFWSPLYFDMMAEGRNGEVRVDVHCWARPDQYMNCWLWWSLVGSSRVVKKFIQLSRVEAVSNTSTVTLRVVGSDEKEVSNLRQ
jgi:hypothetical protein